MEIDYSKYELVVGLEIHAQLSTKSKAYASDSAEFGAMPNTQISAITLGHPGTLPKVNEKQIEFAVKIGLATNCLIRYENQFARKNYFYADLPKGYQITQDKTPICYNGFIDLKLPTYKKKIGITRIHMEEDAGKSMHDQDLYDSLIDLNRAGVPLVEIVSEPDLRTLDEIGLYITEIRKLLRYLDICDGNMEEGSMRCDANISVRIKGSQEFGNRCEVKNLNSIKNVQKAVEYEFYRQIEAIEKGERIDQNTLNFDPLSGKTSVLRTKEMANDYRYFPEPDIPPVFISEEYIEGIKLAMPTLPEHLFEKYTNILDLSDTDANVLLENKEIAFYFEELIQLTKNYKAASNWLMGPIKQYLNTEAIEINDFPLKPKQIIEIIELIELGKINYSMAAQILFPQLCSNPEKTALEIALENNLIIESTDLEIQDFISQALALYPEKVLEYKSGKKGLLGLFMGEVMKISKGKLDPKTANKYLIEALEK